MQILVDWDVKNIMERPVRIKVASGDSESKGEY